MSIVCKNNVVGTLLYLLLVAQIVFTSVNYCSTRRLLNANMPQNKSRGSTESLLWCTKFPRGVFLVASASNTPKIFGRKLKRQMSNGVVLKQYTLLGQLCRANVTVMCTPLILTKPQNLHRLATHTCVGAAPSSSPINTWLRLLTFSLHPSSQQFIQQLTLSCSLRHSLNINHINL